MGVLSALRSKFFDRRCRFRDLRRVPPEKRKAQSAILQFYSSANNIGNFLPVLGIQEMLGETLDCWCIHDPRIDFDFVNANYRGAIIGGAGLLHACFTPFWQSFAARCRLPVVIWGVGGCFPDGNTEGGAERKSVTAVADRCALVNVRDEITVRHYGLGRVQISACPTIVYLRKFADPAPRGKAVLFSSHDELVGAGETERIHQVLREVTPGYRWTHNAQSRRMGLDDILEKDYRPAPLVVTTRLHGAIIAYGLGVPYVAVARDEKLRDFQRLYGNGELLEDVGRLAETIRSGAAQVRRAIEWEPVLEFGERARRWAADLRG